MDRRVVEWTALAAGAGSTVALFALLAPGALLALRDGLALAGPLVNSLLVTLWALLLDAALAFPAAVWLTLHPRGTAALDAAIDALGAAPSVIAGLFGLALFVRLLGLGFSMLAGGLTLGVLNLPLAIRMLQAAFGAERTLLEGGLALGAGPEDAFFRLVWPSVARGVLAPVFQVAARCMGETAALYLTSGVFGRGVAWDPLDPGPTLSLRLFYLLIQGRGNLEGLTSAVAFLMIGTGLMFYGMAGVLARKEARHWRTRRLKSRP